MARPSKQLGISVLPHGTAPPATPGPLGRNDRGDPNARTLAGDTPGSLGVRDGTAHRMSNETFDIWSRILYWRLLAEKSGRVPNAVKALDHYIGRFGTFVEIPESKVRSVRQYSEADHIEKAFDRFYVQSLPEAVRQWNAVNGIDVENRKVAPSEMAITLQFESGNSHDDGWDDFLTYNGLVIVSEVTAIFRVWQPVAGGDRFQIEMEPGIWKSWVADNYDWEGEKKLGYENAVGSLAITGLLGVPSQREMHQLAIAGLARPYQRSSRSWIVKTHDLKARSFPISNFAAFKKEGDLRVKHKGDVKKEDGNRYAGALPTPRPAEEMRR